MAGLLKEITDLPSLSKIDVGLGDYFHVKRGVVDYKITLGDLTNFHTSLRNNPHGVTKAQVGLGNVTNNEQLKLASNLADITDKPLARTNLDVFSKAEVATKVGEHASLKNNPHAVTKAQVGLGSVMDYPITDSYTDSSSNKYASARACRGLYDLVNSQFQRGMIILWSGSISSIPAGWALCNGGNNTPNLIDRFVVCAGGSYGVGSTGGVNSVTHSHSISIQGHVLSASEMPSHVHKVWSTRSNQEASNVGGLGCWSSKSGFAGSLDANGFYGQGFMDTDAAGHQLVQHTGGNASHSHGASANSVSSDNRPPYYALAYIMKL